jgi:hypothetical protein
MGYFKDMVIEVQEFVWDFFDENGKFVADESIINKDELLEVVGNNYGDGGVDIAKEEIFAIETADHFS